jgi:hypothetical protein
MDMLSTSPRTTFPPQLQRVFRKSAQLKADATALYFIGTNVQRTVSRRIALFAEFNDMRADREINDPGSDAGILPVNPQVCAGGRRDHFNGIVRPESSFILTGVPATEK